MEDTFPVSFKKIELFHLKKNPLRLLTNKIWLTVSYGSELTRGLLMRHCLQSVKMTHFRQKKA